MTIYNNRNVTSFLFHKNKINWKSHTSTFFATHHKTVLSFNTRIIVITCKWGNGWTLLPERVLLAIGVWAAVEYDTSLGSSGESFLEVRSPAVIYTVSFFSPWDAILVGIPGQVGGVYLEVQLKRLAYLNILWLVKGELRFDDMYAH